jgi:hypothetical protein
MSVPYSRMNAKEILDLYFIENRARILDIASFLDRIDRHEGAEEARADFRYRAFVRALKLLLDTEENRTKALQMNFSDLSVEPLESAVGLVALGAWEGTFHEGH